MSCHFDVLSYSTFLEERMPNTLDGEQICRLHHLSVDAQLEFPSLYPSSDPGVHEPSNALCAHHIRLTYAIISNTDPHSQQTALRPSQCHVLHECNKLANYSFLLHNIQCLHDSETSTASWYHFCCQ
jgi:hypothetical protein